MALRSGRTPKQTSAIVPTFQAAASRGRGNLMATACPQAALCVALMEQRAIRVINVPGFRFTACGPRQFVPERMTAVRCVPPWNGRCASLIHPLINKSIPDSRSVCIPIGCTKFLVQERGIDLDTWELHA